VITIFLDFMLIPHYGARGAAWATAVSYTLSTLLLYVVFLRKSALSFRVTLGWRFGD
jgi:Na+-driven multidrug efflux pump